MMYGKKPASKSTTVKTAPTAKKPFKVCASCPSPNKCAKAGVCGKKMK
jgi:hypothetical protein